jgi:ionotropic glutamate receptor
MGGQSMCKNMPEFLYNQFGYPTFFTAALFDDNSGPQEAVLQRAIDMVNDDQTIRARSLVPKGIARYPQDDSFKASKKLCVLIQPEIAAVFGPTSPFSANHVQSVSEALHVPFMETRWDYDFKIFCNSL